MKLVSIKTGSESPLVGVTVEFTSVDKRLREVRITDAEGNILNVGMDTYSQLSATTIAPPETAERWVVTGSVVGVDINETFEHEYAANERVNQIVGVGGDAQAEKATVVIEA